MTTMGYHVESDEELEEDLRLHMLMATNKKIQRELESRIQLLTIQNQKSSFKENNNKMKNRQVWRLSQSVAGQVMNVVSPPVYLFKSEDVINNKNQLLLNSDTGDQKNYLMNLTVPDKEKKRGRKNSKRKVWPQIQQINFPSEEKDPFSSFSVLNSKNEIIKQSDFSPSNSNRFTRSTDRVVADRDTKYCPSFDLTIPNPIYRNALPQRKALIINITAPQDPSSQTPADVSAIELCQIVHSVLHFQQIRLLDDSTSAFTMRNSFQYPTKDNILRELKSISDNISAGSVILIWVRSNWTVVDKIKKLFYKQQGDIKCQTASILVHRSDEKITSGNKKTEINNLLRCSIDPFEQISNFDFKTSSSSLSPTIHHPVSSLSRCEYEDALLQLSEVSVQVFHILDFCGGDKFASEMKCTSEFRPRKDALHVKWDQRIQNDELIKKIKNNKYENDYNYYSENESVDISSREFLDLDLLDSQIELVQNKQVSNFIQINKNNKNNKYHNFIISENEIVKTSYSSEYPNFNFDSRVHHNEIFINQNYSMSLSKSIVQTLAEIKYSNKHSTENEMTNSFPFSHRDPQLSYLDFYKLIVLHSRCSSNNKHFNKSAGVDINVKIQSLPALRIFGLSAAECDNIAFLSHLPLQRNFMFGEFYNNSKFYSSKNDSIPLPIPLVRMKVISFEHFGQKDFQNISKLHPNNKSESLFMNKMKYKKSDQNSDMTYFLVFSVLSDLCHRKLTSIKNDDRYCEPIRSIFRERDYNIGEWEEIPQSTFSTSCPSGGDRMTRSVPSQVDPWSNSHFAIFNEEISLPLPKRYGPSPIQTEFENGEYDGLDPSREVLVEVFQKTNSHFSSETTCLGFTTLILPTEEAFSNSHSRAVESVCIRSLKGGNVGILQVAVSFST